MKIKILVLATALLAGLGARYFVEQNTADEYVASSNVKLGMLQSGQDNINLFDNADERVRVVYFGYTHCPDVCPTSLAILSASAFCSSNSASAFCSASDESDL